MLKWTKQPLDGTYFQQLRYAGQTYLNEWVEAGQDKDSYDYFIPSRVRSIYAAGDHCIVRHHYSEWFHYWFRDPTDGWTWYAADRRLKGAKMSAQWHENDLAGV